MRTSRFISVGWLLVLAANGCTGADPDPGPGSLPAAGGTAGTVGTGGAPPFPTPNPSYDSILRPAPFNLHPRSTCRVATDSFVYPDVRTVVDGDPSPGLAAGFNCVETGHTGPTPNVVYTDVDNPRVWTGISLSEYQSASGGTVYPAWLRDDAEVVGQAVDLMAQVSGGEGTAAGDRTSGKLASIAEPLTPWSGKPGPFSSLDGTGDFMPFLGGLRVGKTPIKTRLDDDGDPAAFAVNVALDSEVMLVPVQAVVFYPEGTNPPTLPEIGKPESQLALWDRVATPGTPWHALGDGMSTTHRPLKRAVVGGEVGPWQAQVAGTDLPDDVWAKCGVQFRLVSLILLPVSQKYLKPKGHSTLSGTLSEFWELIEAQPQFQDDVATVLFAPFCSDYDAAAPGQLYPPNGQSLPGHQFACVRAPGAPENVLAHELGHVVGLDHADCPKNPPSPYDRNLMCPNGDHGVALVSHTQCAAVRKNLAQSGLLKWFPAQQ